MAETPIIDQHAGLNPPPLRDEDGLVTYAFVATVEEAIKDDDAHSLKALVEDLHEADVADLLEALAADDRAEFIKLLGDDFDFTALTEVDDAVREEILEVIPNETIAEAVMELENDDAVTILEDLPEEDKAEVLARLPLGERISLQRGLDFPEGSVGRLMQTDFIAVPPFWSVGQVIDYCREAKFLPDDFYEIFIIDPAHRLLGEVQLDTLLRADRKDQISELMEVPEHLITATDDAEDAAQQFRRYNLVSAPVLDTAERLIGVLMIDDIVDVIDEAADADIKALGGVKADEEFTDTVLEIARGRFSWLFINLLTAIAASVVIGFFESSLEKMVALAVLMPIVASQGGNAGTQTMTIVVRALATQELGSANAWRVLARECAVGLINGLAFALIMGAVAAYWFASLQLGLVIGAALVVNLLAAALAGVAIPLVLDRYGADPAVASGTFVTTVTDIVGFFAFLGVATLWFNL